MRPLIIIPARAGSKRLPNKNMRMLCGKPLVQWTVTAAVNSNLGKVVISSDHEGMESFGGMFKPRHLSLCRDDTPLIDVVIDVANHYNHEGPLIVLQPTSPLRTAEDIRRAWDQYTGNGSLASYEDIGKHQRLLTTNGAIWILQSPQTGFYDEPHGIYLMPRERSIDIDTEADFLLAEAILDKTLSKS